jgi:hypothetical protein
MLKSAYAELFERDHGASGAAAEGRSANSGQKLRSRLPGFSSQSCRVSPSFMPRRRKAFPEMSRFEPVPLVLGAYVAITLSRLGLAYRRRLAGMLLGAFV